MYSFTRLRLSCSYHRPLRALLVLRSRTAIRSKRPSARRAFLTAFGKSFFKRVLEPRCCVWDETDVASAYASHAGPENCRPCCCWPVRDEH